jgi:Pre-toxin TG
MKYLFLFILLSCSLSAFGKENSFNARKKLSALYSLDRNLKGEIKRLELKADKHSKQIATWRLEKDVVFVNIEDLANYDKTPFNNAVKEALLIRKILEIDSTILNKLYDYAIKHINNLDDSVLNVKKIDVKNILAIAYLKALLIPDEQASISFYKPYTNIIKKLQAAEQDQAMADKIMTDAKLQLTADIATAIPLLGEAIDIYGICSGEDAITGRQLSKMERGFNAFMLLAPDLLTAALAKNPALAKKLAGFSTKLADKSSSMTGAMAKKAAAIKKKLALVLKKSSKKLSKILKNKHDDMLKALKGSDEEIFALYKNGGMKNLAELERLGKISKKQADKLNSVISKNVDSAINTGTQDAMRTFQSTTDVKIKKVWQGDSGSSAMGKSGRSVNTDADRTFIVDFDQADLERYAKANHGGDISKAQKSLQNKFCKKQKQFTNESLQARTGLKNNDVGYETYSGMDGSGGPIDAYPSQITQARQTQGSTKTYEFNNNGGIKSNKTSGQALTDHKALTDLKNDPTTIIPEGPKITPDRQSTGIIEQQIQAINKGNISPEKAAKALLRADKSAAILKLSRANPKLTKIANKLRGSNPQDVYKSMTAQQQRDFIKECEKAIRIISKEAK